MFFGHPNAREDQREVQGLVDVGQQQRRRPRRVPVLKESFKEDRNEFLRDQLECQSPCSHLLVRRPVASGIFLRQ